MDTKNFYQRGRYFECDGKRSKTFIDVLPSTLTLQPPQRLLEVYGTGSCYITPFKEVKVVPYDQVMPDSVRLFLDEWKGIRAAARTWSAPLLTRPRSYSEGLLNAVEQALIECWEPNKFHVVTHSSGYDTRLISVALKRLTEEMGEQWLGEVVFLEGDGEAEMSKKLLDIEGWGDHRFIKYNAAEQDVHEYHKRSIKFEDAWKRFESSVGFPLNVWWEPVEWAQEMGYVPADDQIQCVSGFGSNEIAKGYNTFQGLGWYSNWIYHHPLSCFKTKGEWLYPYWSMTLWRFMQIHRLWRYRNCGIAKHAIRHVAPETLQVQGASIADREPTVRLLSDRLVKQAADDYSKSWYGKNIEPHRRPMTNLMDYSPFWGAWCLASLCEHLRQAGYNIEEEIR